MLVVGGRWTVWTVGGPVGFTGDFIVFANRPVSWMAVFNAMPTICFGFQVPAPGSPAVPLAHFPTLGGPSGYGWDGRIPGRTDEPRAPGLSRGRFPTMTAPFTWTVPCEQCARLQQHAAARDKDLGWSGDRGHGHSPGCLHGHR